MEELFDPPKQIFDRPTGPGRRERGTLERVTQLAGNWFSAHLPDKPKGSRTA